MEGGYAVEVRGLRWEEPADDPAPGPRGVTSYGMAEVERLLAEVGEVWPADPYCIAKCGKLKRMRLALWGLRDIVERHGLPARLSDWTDADKLLFKLALP